MFTEERSEQADQTNIAWGANATNGPNSQWLWVLQRGLLWIGSCAGHFLPGCAEHKSLPKTLSGHVLGQVEQSP